MLRTALIVLVLALPALAHAHPGKTDRYGGHKCFKKCENWGLLFDEYHLHDREGRPVRVAQKRGVPPEPAAGPAPVPAEEGPRRQQPLQETVTVYRQVRVILDEDIIPRSPLVFVLLVLLILLLILRIRNTRKEKN